MVFRYVVAVAAHDDGALPLVVECQDVLVEILLLLCVMVLDFQEEVFAEVIEHRAENFVRILVLPSGDTSGCYPHVILRE